MRLRTIVPRLAMVIGLAGCLSFYSLDGALDAAVGKTSDEVHFPPLGRSRIVGGEGGTILTEYELSGAGRCKWQFVSEGQSKKILSWRYPDEHSRTACRELAGSRP